MVDNVEALVLNVVLWPPTDQPVARCFLRALHEGRLSGPADRKASLACYERERQAGCDPGLDTAIARVTSSGEA